MASMSGDDSTSSASETSAESATREEREKETGASTSAQKKRKVTYYHRKDEIAALKVEIKTLQETLQVAERAALLGKTDPLETLSDAARTAFYDKSIERNNLKLAGTQAMLSSYNMSVGKTASTIPLKSYVHLPIDPTQRQDIMRAMHLDKLRAAYKFMTERTRGVDLNVPHRQNEQFDFPNGEIALVGFDVTHFDTGHSLRQVYDAFTDFINNQEISMSTELGLLTIRESVQELGEATFTQTRFLTAYPEGLEVESNSVLFTACVDQTEENPGYAIGVSEFVDQDDLYPYRPHECGRRDMTAAVQFTTLPNVDTTKPPIVVVCRWAHIRFQPPTFPLSKDLEAATRIRLSQNDKIAFQIMRERLATIPPEKS